MKSFGLDTADLLKFAPSAAKDLLARRASQAVSEKLASAGSTFFDLDSGVPANKVLNESIGGERLAGIAGPGSYSEEVIVRELAPVYRIEHGAVHLGQLDQDEEEESDWHIFLKDRLDTINALLPSVGQVKVRLSGSSYTTLGTAWVTQDGVMVTNRHVAKHFAMRGTQGLRFLPTTFGSSPMDCRIDFSDLPDADGGILLPADGILYLSKDNRPDIALLKLSEGMERRFKPLMLNSGELRVRDRVAAIGYPQHDQRARKQDIERVYGDVFGCKRLSAGYVKEVSGDTIAHLCNTLGGNSGSPLVSLESGQVVGLHFGGAFDLENYAEPASTIKDTIANLSRESSLLFASSINTTENQPMTTDTLQSGSTITVTVPVTITVSVGSPALNGSSEMLGVAAVQSADQLDNYGPATFEDAVSSARKKFQAFHGVVRIRAGWKFRNGWITDERAIVIAVQDRLEPEELAALGAVALPDQFAGFPVDIVTASPFDLIPALQDELLTEAPAREGTYTRSKTDFPLKLASRKMHGTVHVGPDAGSEMLTDFLAETNTTLTVGMYEFTAPHIVEGVRAAVGEAGTMSMVLQKGEHIGSGTKANDQPDEQTVEELQSLMGSRFENRWASIGQGAIFPYAYHIKLAVRDSTAFWLSSGSWQSSNQPPALRQTPQDANASPFLGDQYNREWHVVLEDAELAKQFEKHILEDAKDVDRLALESAGQDDQTIWIGLDVDEGTVEEATLPRQYFEPLIIPGRKISARPILTPDNYPEHVLKLLSEAKSSILFQNQSLNIAVNRDARFTELLEILREKQAKLDDVRMIIRGEFAREQVEKMKTFGFDVSPGKLRLQDRCHAKTLIVDGQHVLIGSHNFTNSGTTGNRDASIIFDDAEIADYSRKIFEYDWTRSRAAVRERRRGARRHINEAADAAGFAPVHISALGLL